eukprot:10453079-Lingulodinium_polyedra.AAC.1
MTNAVDPALEERSLTVPALGGPLPVPRVQESVQLGVLLDVRGDALAAIRHRLVKGTKAFWANY